MSSAKAPLKQNWIFSGVLDSLLILNKVWLIPVVLISIYFKFEEQLLLLCMFGIYPVLRDTHKISPMAAIASLSPVRNSFLASKSEKLLFAFIILVPTLIITVAYCVSWHRAVACV